MLEIVKNSDAIIVLGSRISVDMPELKVAIEETIKNNGAQFVYMHPIDDKELEETYTQFIKYEVGSEEGVIALLASYIVKQGDEKIQDYLDDLDIGYISAESNVGEEELEELVENFDSKSKKLLVIGNDILKHSRVKNIAKLISAIEKYSDFKVLFLKDELLTNDESLEEVEELDTYNGCVIYGYELSQDSKSLKGSQAFATAAKIKAGDMVNIGFDGTNDIKQFELDPDMKGTVALYPLNSVTDFGYRFKQVRISKVDR